MKMPLVISAAWILRIFGPCPISEIVRRSALSHAEVCEEVRHLLSHGLIKETRAGYYDVTLEGRARAEAGMRDWSRMMAGKWTSKACVSTGRRRAWWRP